MGLQINSKGKTILHDTDRGVCVWEINGALLSDGNGNYLSLEGKLHDPIVEEKMRKAAWYWLDDRIGRPRWLADRRKITDDEWEEQRARMSAGLIPDPIEAAKIALGIIK